jgi:hypothetical protein
MNILMILGILWTILGISILYELLQDTRHVSNPPINLRKGFSLFWILGGPFVWLVGIIILLVDIVIVVVDLVMDRLN